MKKRLPAPSSEYEHVENFLEEIIIPQQQVELNSLFNAFITIETIVKLQPQYSDFSRNIEQEETVGRLDKQRTCTHKR